MTEAFRTTELAAVRTAPKRRPQRYPVETVTVDRRVWKTALRLSEGDVSRITIVSATRVEVR